MKKKIFNEIINELSLDKTVQTTSGYSERVCFDDYWLEGKEKTQFIKFLESRYPGYTFEIQWIMSGFAIDLVKKAAYDALPKTKTVRQAVQELQTSQGLFISLFSPQSMDDNITDEE